MHHITTLSATEKSRAEIWSEWSSSTPPHLLSFLLTCIIFRAILKTQRTVIDFAEEGAVVLLLPEETYIPGVMKTGSANLNFWCNFSQLPLSNISLFAVLFTAYVGFFRVFLLAFWEGICFQVDVELITPLPSPRAFPAPSRPYAFCWGRGGREILNGRNL